VETDDACRTLTNKPRGKRQTERLRRSGMVILRWIIESSIMRLRVR
jgi:hypothetical protein